MLSYMLENTWFYIHLIRGFLNFHLNEERWDNTARHPVWMKRIVCTIERAEMQISINRIGRAEVMVIKTIETRRVGVQAFKSQH